ncbi:hypothetical protein Zmor_017515 [Zophobas morio]|uniref:Uncharacterized protein n=1 Tax=Zophobas morio TaxID=2755281 RepID=A0AA38ICN5_9CUCU|nr:hypothetical protein Zmor_017515 [Zophobas morio]
MMRLLMVIPSTQLSVSPKARNSQPPQLKYSTQPLFPAKEHIFTVSHPNKVFQHHTQHPEIYKLQTEQPTSLINTESPASDPRLIQLALNKSQQKRNPPLNF